MKSSKSSRKPNLQQKLKVYVPRDYPWKVLDNFVDDLSNCLSIDNIQEIKAIIRNRDYESYLALSKAWGPQGTNLGDNECAEMYARYQVASLLKKFQFPGDTKSRRDAAKDSFLEAETVCSDYNREGYKHLALLEEEDELNAYTYARSFIQKILGSVLPPRDTLTFWSRHGPGANLDTKDRSVSLYNKYMDWPYSCTKDALELARLSIQDDVRWLGALEDSYRERFNLSKTVILDQQHFWSSVLHVVPGNRISFVPKNSLTDRSIAIEPCMNLYLQLGVDGYIRRRLKRWGVDLDSQTKNQELARQGSLNWESPESFVTLDLAAASDSISLELCRLLLPVQWYYYLLAIRSPSGEIDGETLVYNKVSSMGNGFTFALESLIFASLCYGATKTIRGRFDRDSIAVFGDDIVVPKPCADLTIRMLNRCGFSINSEKSFIEGCFRESCGADWFKGKPVRPVFLTSQPSTVMELWCDSNRIRRILNLRVWCVEPKTCQLIDKWVPDTFGNCTGPYSDEDFDSYKHVAVPSSRYKNCLYKFKRLVIIPKGLRGESFLFRKLMHSLRDVEHSIQFQSKTWGGARVAGSGSRFTVTRNNSVTVGYTYSPAGFWQDEYSEL